MAENFFYFSIEKTGGWLSAPSSQRAQVIEARKPKYVTVLDLDRLVADDEPLEETLKVRYSGPFYADWDCESIIDGAASVNRFLDLLEQSYGVDPACVAIYASGGRGYHAEVPFACFSSTKGGTQYLPQIFREVANDLYTESLDMAVYSAKRGRMWRTPNVPRESGAFKVPLTLDEIRSEMTDERYAELCRAPRPGIERAPAVLSPQLAAMFSDHQTKVSQRLRERAKKKNDDTVIRRFNGDWPDSIKAVMRGENLSKDVGLNKIALQLGILSNALGKSWDEHFVACEGLIKNYRGDGHGTRRAVREELKRMFGYACGNSAYTYSPSAMAAIMEVPQLAKDLRGTAAPMAGTDANDMSDLARGVINGSNGIYTIKDDTLHRETNWHFDAESAVEIVDAETNQSRGFLLQGMDSGNPTQEINLDHSTFVSGDRFKNFLASKGATAPRMDTIKAGSVLALIMQAARANGRVYALHKEGFNLIGDEMIWCSPLGCWAHNSKDTFRFRGSSGSEGGNFKSDVMSAPQLNEFGNAAAVVDALMSFNNNDYTVAATLGWFAACWHKPLHVALHGSFPILQAYGESGAGKTLAFMQMLKMFYFEEQPRAMNASQGSAYGRRVMFSGSSTIPVLVDEFKPSKMSVEAVREFQMTIHEMYTPSFQAPRGGGDARSNSPGNWAELSFETKTTPLCFTTETAESETAIQERTISVPFSKAQRSGKANEAFQVLHSAPEALAALGKLMLLGTAASKRETLKSLIARSHEVATEHLSRSGNSRIVYNAGVVLAGLGFLGMVLKHHLPEQYAERFDERLKVLRAAVLEPTNYAALQAAPEIVKLLRFMTTISHQDSQEAEWNVRHGIEYAYHGKELDLDISVDAFFLRYRTAAQRRSQLPAFQNPDAFLAALRSSSLAKESSPPDTTLNSGTNAPRVVRLSSAALDEYGLGAFKV
jgi:hypothetical protein